MKFIITILLIINSCFARSYFVKSAGGTGNGTSNATAWSFAKFLTIPYTSGDSVYFNRGDVFNGTLLVPVVRNDFYYGAYGTGSNPKFTGFKTLSSWTLYSGNVYYVSLTSSSLNVVSLDDVIMAMGRYPKNRYLPYTAHSGNTSITANSISTIPFNPTGAEIVIRKQRQITDRMIVTSRSGNTLNISTNGSPFGSVYLNNNSYDPTDGYGYFIQSSLSTLTSKGDWYFDSTNQRLYMHFGTGTPSGHIIKASTVNYNTTIAYNSNYITFDHLDFEGANIAGAFINVATHVKFIDCNFYKQYDGIYSNNGMNNLSIRGGSMYNVLNNGVFVVQSGNKVTVDSTVFNNTGVIAGAGGSGDGQQICMNIIGDSSIITNCVLTNLGYQGINPHGNVILVENNRVDSFGFIKDDCGGIYFAGFGLKGGMIRNNTVLHPVGVFDGAPSYAQISNASGIYIDNADSVQVLNNIVAHGTFSGIMLVDVGSGIEIKNNLVYDNHYQFQIYCTRQTAGLTVTGNKFICRDLSQVSLYIDLFSNVNISQFGTFSNNYYKRIGNDSAITINREYAGGNGLHDFKLSQWKSAYNHDRGSISNARTMKQNGKILKYNGKVIMISQ